GVFSLLRLAAMEKNIQGIDTVVNPDIPLRMLDHWDNCDGSIERGYAGRSFFFRDGKILVNERTRDYARLISSVGINAVAINNVNVDKCAAQLLNESSFTSLSRLAKVFSGYGIRLFLSINYASPMLLGGLDTADPEDGKVKIWWKKTFHDIFSRVPNLGGFIVKADSEGCPGPLSYGRSQACGANFLADLVKEYHAVIVWRCFVYNCRQDWRDYTSDRAKAAYDNFIGFDGAFRENVFLQIKNGPMDFQIREPVSPLFGKMQKTNQILELQLAQEYTGQQIDICYLLPMFKEILGFRTYCRENNDTVGDIIRGVAFPRKHFGIAAVANTGDAENWTGSDLAAANLYGFGRLAFSPDLSPSEIAHEWISLTLTNDKTVTDVLLGILLRSREIYEKYTTPFGIGWMVTPNTHYGPSVDGYEYSQWGTYHRADHTGIGVERSSRGTGFTKQYFAPNTKIFDTVSTCPENLLLFFHRVPYAYVMRNGKTLLQNIYDSHFEGAEDVKNMIERFMKLKGLIPNYIFERILARLKLQLKNAEEWRDQVNTYFYRKTGINDVQGRKIY
ncbi:MAG: alpha-glucuronidase, partial [Sphaerochaetaceae bacterium]